MKGMNGKNISYWQIRAVMNADKLLFGPCLFKYTINNE